MFSILSQHAQFVKYTISSSTFIFLACIRRAVSVMAISHYQKPD